MERIFKDKELNNLNLIESKRYINTPSEEVKNTFLYAQEVGYLKSLKPHVSGREYLDSYLFVIVLSGSGKLTYCNRVYELSKQDCFFINCMNHYSHEGNETDLWELLWVHFNGPTAAKMYEFFRKTSPHIFHPSSTGEIIETLKKLVEIHGHKDRTTEVISSKLINDLITYSLVIPRRKKENSETVKENISLVRDYINENYYEKISLDQLSEKFFISKYYLSREFKKLYGITISNYILIKKITYAKELLRFSDKSIEEIGALCGFLDPSYFNKVFKKSESMTPSEYRKRW